VLDVSVFIRPFCNVRRSGRRRSRIPRPKKHTNCRAMTMAMTYGEFNNARESDLSNV
jgi:hypothetical protein